MDVSMGDINPRAVSAVAALRSGNGLGVGWGMSPRTGVLGFGLLLPLDFGIATTVKVHVLDTKEFGSSLIFQEVSSSVHVGALLCNKSQWENESSDVCSNVSPGGEGCNGVTLAFG
uniref:Uncharacterized protein n=1 Tax=Peronospora matthiolae TaxID=2874970 RepID=A0AAV1UUE4_9STRA